MTVFRPAPLAQTSRRAVLPALAIALTLALSPNAFAIDLAQAFESAQRYDTLLNSARLQLDAARERLPQAQAGLKPSLGAVAGATAGRLDTDVAASRSFDNLSGGLNFSYPLYRRLGAGSDLILEPMAQLSMSTDADVTGSPSQRYTSVCHVGSSAPPCSTARCAW